MAVLTVVVAAAAFLLRGRSAHARYLLWLIVLAKCLVPPVHHLSLPVLPPAQPPVSWVSPAPVAAPALEADSAAFTSANSGPDRRAETEATAASRTQERPVRWGIRAWLGLGWLVGAAGLSILYLLKALRMEWWLRRRRRPLSGQRNERLEGLAVACGVKRLSAVWLVPGIGQPFVWGLVRGSVHLPAALLHENEPRRLASLLGHEFSHVLRYDAFVNVLQVIAQVAFWFHPCVWWTNAKIRAEREKCCDEATIARLHCLPEDYSAALVETLAARYEATRAVPSLVVAGPAKNIEERIKIMLKPGKKFHRRPSFVAATVAAFIALVTLPTALVLTARGQAPATQAADPSPGAKAESSRYAARTFNSKAVFEVYVWETRGAQPKRIGQTPSAAPLEIPACLCWWVRPSEPVKDWDLLLKEMSQNKVPGLRLEEATDSDLRHLAEYAGLEYLDLNSTGVTDAGLASLKGLAALQVLNLAATQVTGDGLTHLKDLASLQSLNLDGTLVTDAGLEHLKGLPALRDLDLGGAPITDAGLEHLKSLTGLRSLSLKKTRITDAGLEHLKGFTGLSDLALTNTAITDRGLAYLEGMSGLRSLVLGHNWLTDAGLEHLKGLTGLRTLHLTDIGITDAGLEHLKGLTKLEWLNLGGVARVSDSGLRQLQQSLPKVTIVTERTWSAVQSALKAGPLPYEPATESAELAARGYVARTFDSKVAFDVWVYESIWSKAPTRIGGTPSVAPLKISPCVYWFVQPVAPVKDWDTVIQEMKANRVPGLKLATDTTDSDLKRLAGLTQLDYLSLANTQVTDAGLIHLAGLTELWSLDLEGTRISGPGLEHLKGLARLQQLNLARTPVTDAGLDYLAECRGLERLELAGTRITDVGLEHLKDLPALGDLDLQDTQVTGAALEHLRAKSNLWNLSLKGAPVTDADLTHFKGLTHLGRLVLSNTKITGAGLKSLQGLPQLGNLQIDNTKVADADLVYLEGLTELHQLDASGTEITGPGLAHLKGLTKMRNITLSGTKLGDSGLAHLASLPLLERLWLIGTPITDEGLVYLHGLTGLQVLNLSGTKITDSGLVHLKGLTALQSLGLNGTAITDAGLVHLKNLTGLPVLGLSVTRITDDGLTHLEGLTGLQNLALNGTAITDAGLVHLKDLTGLQQLSLAGTQITDAGLANLKGLSGLQTLNLFRTRVTDAGIQQLKASLPKLTVSTRRPT